MKDVFQKVFLNLLGEQPVDFYITFFILVMVGMLASLSWSAAKRDKYSDNTPVKFKPGFWILDNGQRILSNLALIFIFIRFGTEIFNVIPTYAGAIALGFGSDRLSWLAKKGKEYARNSFAK